jgi:RNA polymerase sigma factor for flagellar operon FliA
MMEYVIENNTHAATGPIPADAFSDEEPATIRPTPDQLVEQNMDFVEKVMASHRLRLPPFTDFAVVRSGAHVGLLEAARRWNGSGTFEKFAWKVMYNQIRDDLRKTKMDSRRHSARRKQLDAATDALVSQLGRPPTEQEMAEYLGITLVTYRRNLMRFNCRFEITSLDALLASDTTRTLHDLLGTVDPEIERSDIATLHSILARCVGRLPAKYRTILRQSYVEGMTLEQISLKQGRHCEARCSQLRRQAIVNLRSIFVRECLKRGITSSELGGLDARAIYVPPRSRIAGLNKRTQKKPQVEQPRQVKQVKRAMAPVIPAEPLTPIRQIVNEAEQLAAARDGVHDMRQACAMIRGYASLADSGDEVDVSRLEAILTKMRICYQTGFYPKEHREAVLAA